MNRRAQHERGVLTDGTLVKRMRTLLGLTQEMLATNAGVDAKTVRKAEHGGPLDLSSLRLLARALHVPYAELAQTKTSQRPHLDANIRLVADWQSACDDSNVRELAPTLDLETVAVYPGSPAIPWAGIICGKKDTLRLAQRTFDAYSVEPIPRERFHERFEVFAIGNRVFMSCGDFTVTFYSNNQSVTIPIMFDFTIDRAKIIHVNQYFDTLSFERTMRMHRVAAGQPNELRRT